MLLGLSKFGEGVCLPRLMRFIAEAGVDADELARRAIVITGSNGKGSTARFAIAALAAAGRRVGCFTSPHMFSLYERFVVCNSDGEREIAPADFDRLAARVLAFNARSPAGDRMGAFELLFLVALLWFEEARPDVVVWEAGIGGRYDPSRVLRARVSVLASVELEHAELLGPTEELIAYDKVDALAPGGVLVVSPAVAADLAHRVGAYARLTGRTPLPALQGRALSGFRNTLEGGRVALQLEGEPARAVRIGLIGRHQVDNAMSGLRAAEVWLGGQAAAARGAMLEALAKARWRGRLERVAGDPDLWIDVGHTPAAVELAAAAFLDLAPRERTLVVFGVSAAKEVRRIAAVVARRFDHFILTRAHKAGADIETFADIFAGCDAVAATDTASAARLARKRAQENGLIVLVLGGLFTAAEVTHAWRGGDPAELNFL